VTGGPNLLLLSSSTIFGRRYLEHALEAVAELIGTSGETCFVPYALVNHDAYTSTMRQALATLGTDVVGLHQAPDPRQAVEQAEVLFVGGGNTFRLVKRVQELGLLEPVRRRVLEGSLRYIGSSAGTNLACPTIRTTNDMPIVQPATFEAFGLVPFQINPHYQDAPAGSTHMGETREQRLEQFLEENDVAVVGLREGGWLRRSGDSLRLAGLAGARLFQRGEPPRVLEPDTDLSWLLARPARFDAAST
jgi:dipeptidase E